MLNQIIKTLQLPESCLVNKKITKAFFKRNFELNSIERALLDDFSVVVAMEWIASISPLNANISPYLDQETTFEEIQVIAVQTTDDNFDKNKAKIADLINKYIPYHILLVVFDNTKSYWTCCLKRINVIDNNKRISDKRFIADNIDVINPSDKHTEFINNIAFGGLDKTNLKTLYESYIQQIVALQTADIIGEYKPRTNERTKQDVANLEKLDALNKEIVVLQNQAKKEVQLNIRVEINTQIQQKRKQVEQIKLQLLDK